MIRSRIAPTPSGFLHIGNAYNFVLTWMITRSKGGTLRLRIDDLDQARVRDEYLNDVFQTLDWLGLDWDEGPSSVQAHKATFSQALRHERYQDVLEKLWEKSGRVFSCRCSRREIQAKSPDGEYPGTCQALGIPKNQPQTAWRLQTPPNHLITWVDHLAGPCSVSLYQEMRDPVIRRKDGIAAYQIASLTDDLDHGINLIVRGMDLMQSTAAQLYLADLLEETGFAKSTFYHHPLTLDDQGEKLSKSAGSISLRTFRERSPDPAIFYEWFARQMNWDTPPLTAAEALEIYLERTQNR